MQKRAVLKAAMSTAAVAAASFPAAPPRRTRMRLRDHHPAPAAGLAAALGRPRHGRPRPACACAVRLLRRRPEQPAASPRLRPPS